MARAEPAAQGGSAGCGAAGWISKCVGVDRDIDRKISAKKGRKVRKEKANCTIFHIRIDFLFTILHKGDSAWPVRGLCMYKLDPKRKTMHKIEILSELLRR